MNVKIGIVGVNVWCIFVACAVIAMFIFANFSRFKIQRVEVKESSSWLHSNYLVTGNSKFSFASYYEDHMVLQRSPKSAVIWGYAGTVGVRVFVSVYGGTYNVTYDTLVTCGPVPGIGVWRVTLDPIKEPGPFDIAARCGQKQVYLRDVLFGDVWLCSGQSNMQFTVIQALNSSQELADTTNFPSIRIFTVGHTTSTTPLYDLAEGGIFQHWSIPSPGESNAYYNRELYGCTFPTMIDDWRLKFYQGSGQTSESFPFGFVQLAPTTSIPTSSAFPDIRWHQTAGYGYAPNKRMTDTFMAVAMDLPDLTSPYGSIHSRDKQDVARRLVRGGLAVAYNKNISFQGPFPVNVKNVLPNEQLMIIVYDQELEIKILHGFEICCPAEIIKNNCDKDMSWLPSAIVEKGVYRIAISTLACSHATVTAVRYSWSESPCALKNCAIYSKHSGLPAPPFIKFLTGDT